MPSTFLTTTCVSAQQFSLRCLATVLQMSCSLLTDVATSKPASTTFWPTLLVSDALLEVMVRLPACVPSPTSPMVSVTAPTSLATTLLLPPLPSPMASPTAPVSREHPGQMLTYVLRPDNFLAAGVAIPTTIATVSCPLSPCDTFDTRVFELTRNNRSPLVPSLPVLPAPSVAVLVT